MRTQEQIAADAEPRSAFSNGTEFEERREPRDGDPEPEPEPPPVIAGQVDMFEVFVEQIAEQPSQPEAVSV